MGKGAYIVKKEQGKPQFTLFATGSEVSLALDVAAALEKRDKSVRVVSMPCWEIFEEQSDAYKQSIVGGDIGRRVSIEAGVSLGWHKWIGSFAFISMGCNAKPQRRKDAKFFNNGDL
jgi:transketolase